MKRLIITTIFVIVFAVAFAEVSYGEFSGSNKFSSPFESSSSRGARSSKKEVADENGRYLMGKLRSSALPVNVKEELVSFFMKRYQDEMSMDHMPLVSDNVYAGDVSFFLRTINKRMPIPDIKMEIHLYFLKKAGKFSKTNTPKSAAPKR